MARLVPYEAAAGPPRTPGAWRGRIVIAEDFDDLPDELADAFGVSG